MATKSDSGKGSNPRPFSNYEDYSSNWDEINWSNNKMKNIKKDKNDERETNPK